MTLRFFRHMAALSAVVVLPIFVPVEEAAATLRYMGPSGSNSNTCVQSQSSGTPKLTFGGASGAKTCMVPGDQLGILDGTYTGTSNQLDLTGMSGTVASRFLIYAVNGPGAVTFNPPENGSPVNACRTFITNGSTANITIQDLVIDRVTCTVFVTGDRFIDTVGVTLKNIEFKNGYYHGFYLSGGSNFTMDGGSIHDANSTCVPGTRSLGMYIHDWISNVTITGVQIYNMPGGGVQVYPGPGVGITFSKMSIHDNGSCTTTDIGGMLFGAFNGNMSGVSVTRSLIFNNGAGGVGGNGGGIRHYGTGFTITGTKFFNNVIYGNQANSGTARGILNNTGSVNSIIANNISLGNESEQILDLGAGTTLLTNKTTGLITDCTPSSSNFTQKSGSTCIDAGTNVGAQFNGAAPDIGAFESFVLSSCQVPNGLAGTIQAQFASNANLLGSTLTTFTARRNGSNNALTGAATKIGDTIISLPITTTYAGGDTADISWASGGLTDNALIGGTLNQPFLPVTNFSCTNNAGAPPTYVLTQKSIQYRGMVGPETTTDIRGTNTVGYPVQQGGGARLRIAVTCTVSNCPPVAFFLRYSLNSGPYTIVPDTYGADNIAMCGNRINNIGFENTDPTTAQMTGVSGTFIPGGMIRFSNAIPTVSGLNAGFKTEMEYAVCFDTDATGQYVFALYEQNGNPLTYFQFAEMLMRTPRAPAGF